MVLSMLTTPTHPMATFLASNGWIRAPPLEKTGRPSVRRAGCAGDVQDGLWNGVCQDARWLGARELAANPSNFAFKTTAPARHKSQMWWSHVVKSQKLVGHTQAMYQHTKTNINCDPPDIFTIGGHFGMANPHDLHRFLCLSLSLRESWKFPSPILRALQDLRNTLPTHAERWCVAKKDGTFSEINIDITGDSRYVSIQENQKKHCWRSPILKHTGRRRHFHHFDPNLI